MSRIQVGPRRKIPATSARHQHDFSLHAKEILHLEFVHLQGFNVNSSKRSCREQLSTWFQYSASEYHIRFQYERLRISYMISIRAALIVSIQLLPRLGEAQNILSTQQHQDEFTVILHQKSLHFVVQHPNNLVLVRIHSGLQE